MLVKCVSCGEKIDRSLAHKVVVGKINKYYCTEKEYQTEVNKKLYKENAYHEIYEIFGYKVTHTSLYKEINEIASIHTYEKLSQYLLDRNSDLVKAMSKDFTSEYGKIRYFSTILKNSLKDFIMESKEIDKKRIIDIAKDTYVPRKRKKTLLEFEEEVGE